MTCARFWARLWDENNVYRITSLKLYFSVSFSGCPLGPLGRSSEACPTLDPGTVSASRPVCANGSFEFDVKSIDS